MQHTPGRQRPPGHADRFAALGREDGHNIQTEFLAQSPDRKGRDDGEEVRVIPATSDTNPKDSRGECLDWPHTPSVAGPGLGWHTTTCLRRLEQISQVELGESVSCRGLYGSDTRIRFAVAPFSQNFSRRGPQPEKQHRSQKVQMAETKPQKHQERSAPERGNRKQGRPAPSPDRATSI